MGGNPHRRLPGPDLMSPPRRAKRRAISSRGKAMVLLGCVSGLCAPALAISPAADRPRAEPYTPIGTRIPQWVEPKLLAEKESVRVLHDFARCIVGRKASDARALLVSPPESKEQQRAGARMVGRPTTCLKNARKMTLKASLFRGAIAEALYAGSALHDPMPDTKAPIGFEAFTTKLAAHDADGLDEEDKGLLVGRWVAYCAVHEGGGLVRSLLQTTPMTPEEAAGMRELNKVFSSCLPDGRSLTVNMLTMRALLAEALYARVAGISYA